MDGIVERIRRLSAEGADFADELVELLDDQEDRYRSNKAQSCADEYLKDDWRWWGLWSEENVDFEYPTFAHAVRGCMCLEAASAYVGLHD